MKFAIAVLLVAIFILSAFCLQLQSSVIQLNNEVDSLSARVEYIEGFQAELKDGQGYLESQVGNLGR